MSARRQRFSWAVDSHEKCADCELSSHGAIDRWVLQPVPGQHCLLLDRRRQRPKPKVEQDCGQRRLQRYVGGFDGDIVVR